MCNVHLIITYNKRILLNILMRYSELQACSDESIISVMGRLDGEVGGPSNVNTKGGKKVSGMPLNEM